MNLICYYPEALWLLAFLALGILLRPKWWNILRIIMVLVAIVYLMDINWTRESGKPRVMAILDLSNSCREDVLNVWQETKAILKKSQPQDGILESFAMAGEARSWPAQENLNLNPTKTHLRHGIISASSSIPTYERAKLLLISDGQSTEPLDGLSSYLSRRGHQLYWRRIHKKPAEDASLSSLKLPEQALPGEPFLVSVEILSSGNSIDVELYRDQQSLGVQNVSLANGRGSFQVKDLIKQPGHYRYTAKIRKHNDSIRGNDAQSQSIRIEGRGGVLVISPWSPDPLVESLRRSGLKVIHTNQPRSLSKGILSGVQGVILHNTPADKMPQDFLKALVPYVELQGGGLLMIGGKHSYASGGYYRSPIDPILPFSMELKEDKHKVSLALGIILDRSGSMGAKVGGGMSKMRLANEGSATAAELLGHNDAIAVFAVDSQPHTIVGLSKVGQDREYLGQCIRSIQSMGGGIYVYDGLAACWGEIAAAPQANKHIILFSDAADSEQPGDYINLVADITATGATVSVIGLGHPSDDDANFLMDIAKRGNGRMFFCDNAVDLPGIFAQETVSVSKSTYLEENRKVGKLKELAQLGIGVSLPETIQAYNLCIARPKATLAALTSDDDKDPLLAFWQRGAGKVLCFASPLAGAHASRLHSWQGYDDLCSSLTRWMMKGELPSGLGLERRQVGESMQFDLYYDKSWVDKIAKSPPRFLMVDIQENQKHFEVRWDQITPGSFRATIPLSENRELFGAVSLGNTQLAAGPLRLGSSAEWTFDNGIIDDLRQSTLLSGGGPAPRLDSLWNQKGLMTVTSLRPALCWVLGILLLLEMLAYKMGWRLLWLGKGLSKENLPLRKSFTAQDKSTEASGQGHSGSTKPDAVDPFKQRLEKMRRR
ncbi:MAG: VWA domain-containing protein [Planctomycetes bacterium]|nr:VWA domain-containing protein [Planctomycetota bacterium]